MSESNKAVIRRLYQKVMGEGDLTVADEIFSPEYLDHMPIVETRDRSGRLESLCEAGVAFPDVRGSYPHESHRPQGRPPPRPVRWWQTPG